MSTIKFISIFLIISIQTITYSQESSKIIKDKVKLIDNNLKISLNKYFTGDTNQIKLTIANHKLIFSCLLAKHKPTVKKTEIAKLINEQLVLAKSSMLLIKNHKLVDYSIIGNAVQKIEGNILYQFDVKTKITNKSNETKYSYGLTYFIYKDKIWEVYMGELKDDTEDEKIQFGYSKDHFNEYFK